jgi:diphthamide synthase (EF-2-diphthine--ammonia ligase)
MMPPQRVLLAWSSGKDSAWALHLLRQQPDIDVVALLTTFHEAAGAVAMHRVPRPLVELQARAAGLPLWPVNLPWPCPNDIYECRMTEACARARAENITTVAFGDLFLEDIRAYRERALAPTGLACIDPNRLPASFCGREFDEPLLLDLPPTVDPCGENGEFHTFVHHAPAFSQPIPFRKLEAVELDGFVYLPLSPL